MFNPTASLMTRVTRARPGCVRQFLKGVKMTMSYRELRQAGLTFQQVLASSRFTTIRIMPRERAEVRTCSGSMQVLGALSEHEMLARARVNISKDVHCLNRENLLNAIDRGDYECIVT
jgi:hypothetical protein